MFKRLSFSKPTGQNKPGEQPSKPRVEGLESLFAQPIPLPEGLSGQFTANLQTGLQLFETYNQNRLHLAYTSFDPPMKAALFDVLYLLHTNGPELSEVRYTTTEIIDYKEKEIACVVDLYVPGAPAGVAGIDQMAEGIKQDFETHIASTFGSNGLIAADLQAPIRGVFSIGSVGTIGHKHLASDLDLQVLYRVVPFETNPDRLTNPAIQQQFDLVFKGLVRNIAKKNQLTKAKQAKDPNLTRKVQGLARQQLAKRYPLLSKQFLLKEVDWVAFLRQKPNPKLKHQLIAEIQRLVKVAESLLQGETRQKAEQALRQKVDRIQEYIASRYPEAEVWLFPMSEPDMQGGHFRSTLESKESSGSAYELILTYDTLMPGVFFTPVVPSHFLFDQKNNQPEAYQRNMELIRFGLLDPVFGDVKNRLEDQGPTPNLEPLYVQQHHGAIYWEAFKASSGNLPKAMMNLLRYETLLYPKTNKTMIQLIKSPGFLDRLLERLEQEPGYAKLKAQRDESGLWSQMTTPKKLTDIQARFPTLTYDPWWLRYKLLKLAYCEQVVGPMLMEERYEISDTLDLAFALHIRLSDVFPRAGQAFVANSHREQVLARFLETAFPEGTERRQQLEGIFMGDTHLVTAFEKQMRRVFKQAINRIAKKLDQMGVEDQRSANPELQIWYHYYQKNFEPLPHVVQPTILQHLKVPRGRVIAGYDAKYGWFFKAFQKNTVRGFGQSELLSHLPEETVLIDGVGFLKGLAHCIFNGYYGVLNKGTLKESYTSFELSGTQMNLGNEMDNQFGYVQPGQVEAVMHRILKLFPPQKIDYRACLMEKEQVNELYVFLNFQGCGKLSFLYRNNLGNVMVKEVELDEFHQNAKQYHELNQYKTLFASPILHQGFQTFLTKHQIKLGKVKVEVWVNDNSFETNHSLTNQARKQADLLHEFRSALFSRAYTPLRPRQVPRYAELESLEQVVFCGALVAAIDGEVDNKEYPLCTNTLKQSWDKKWGPVDEAFSGVLKKLKQFLSVKSLLNHNLTQLSSNIRFQLTLDQQTAMLGLMRAVSASDPKNEANKKALIQTFEQALEIEPSQGRNRAN